MTCTLRVRLGVRSTVTVTRAAPLARVLTYPVVVVRVPCRVYPWFCRSRTFWSRALRGRTVALWVVWFCVNLSYYGAFIWLPTLLFAQGFGLVKSFEYTLIITVAQLPGYAAAAFLIERWGRRSTLATFLIGSAVAAALFGIAGTPVSLIAAGCALSFFNLGAWGALYAVGPELYPTSVRASATGAAAGFGPELPRLGLLFDALVAAVAMLFAASMDSDFLYAPMVTMPSRT